MIEVPTISVTVHFRTGAHGRKQLRSGAPPVPVKVPRGRIPLVARRVAMAIRIDALIRQGAIADYADAARQAHVTRARMTQVMDLLCLAPDLLEEILFLPRTIRGRDAITERSLRPVIAEPEFEKQRHLWQSLRVPKQTEAQPPRAAGDDGR